MKGVSLLVLLLAALPVLAQPYPSRPVRIVVPLSPGGFADTPARMLAPRLSEQLGRQFFVENKPGAGGTIGADFVAKSPPDGYTLLLTGTPHVISAHLYKKLPYDALKDFTHITLVASGPYALVVNPQKVAASSVRELDRAAKAQPGKIDYASSGNGSAQHLVSALFNAMAGIELNHVPYKGSGPAMQDLVAGQVGVSFAGIPNVLSHLRAGRLRALAVSTPKRWSELPDMPDGRRGRRARATRRRCGSTSRARPACRRKSSSASPPRSPRRCRTPRSKRTFAVPASTPRPAPGRSSSASFAPSTTSGAKWSRTPAPR